MVIRLGYLVSGGASSFEALETRLQEGRLEGFESALLVCSKPRGEVGAYERADRLEVPSAHTSSTREQLGLFDNAGVDMVLGLGYVKKVGAPMLDHFGRLIWNIHPTLLPKHGGKNMYGLATHQAVIDAGDKETGPTVHVMNGHYDEGDILNQIKVKVFPGETAAQMQKRVLQYEYQLMADTLALFRDNRLLNCPRD